MLVFAKTQAGEDRCGALALLTPLLRCCGNMAASKSAAAAFLRPDLLDAASKCAQLGDAGVEGEALWVLSNLAAASSGYDGDAD